MRPLTTPCASNPSTSRPLLQAVQHVPRHSVRGLGCARPLVRATTQDAAPFTAVPISVTDEALAHLKQLKEKKGDENLLLRIGVKSGGCSGLSYVMDFESPDKVGAEDSVMEYDGFNLVCDPQSLLYLFGVKLDYSDALVGGGFKFTNPNAEDTCGCGKSFGV